MTTPTPALRAAPLLALLLAHPAAAQYPAPRYDPENTGWTLCFTSRLYDDKLRAVQRAAEDVLAPIAAGGLTARRFEGTWTLGEHGAAGRSPSHVVVNDDGDVVAVVGRAYQGLNCYELDMSMNPQFAEDEVIPAQSYVATSECSEHLFERYDTWEERSRWW